MLSLAITLSVMCKSNFVQSQKLGKDSPLESGVAVKTSHRTISHDAVESDVV